MERLLEYERFRKAAQALEDGTLLGRDVFEGGQSAAAHLNIVPPTPEVELWDLVSALKGALDRARLRGHVHHIDIERFSVVDRIHVLHDLLGLQGATGFRALLDGLNSRMDIILTFLAVLEMAKRGIVAMAPAMGPEGEVLHGLEADWMLSLREEADPRALPPPEA